MRAALLPLLLAPLLQQDVDDKEAKQLLVQFNKAYGNAREDEGQREGALAFLRQKHHPILLDRLIEVGKLDRSAKVRAACAEGLGEYRQTKKAAKALVDMLDNKPNADAYLISQRAFESLGSLDCAITREHAEDINKWYSFREANVAKAAAAAAGTMRHVSSIEPLLDEMQRCQREMLKFITGEKIDGCDGG
jgi:HEAT repeat protein